ncbi:MYG protein, partial [Amia calva]|nr:MYG protein [Amia calva]
MGTHSPSLSLSLSLFKAHPATIQLFPKFRSLSEAEIQESAAVSNHGATVINKLGDLLSRRGEYGAELKPMAQSHAHTHKIPLENFTLISEVIVQLMKEKVAGFGGDSEAAMRKALAALVTDLQGLYKELGFKG